MTRDKRYQIISSVIISLIAGLCFIMPKLLFILAIFGVIALSVQIMIWSVGWAEKGRK